MSRAKELFERIKSGGITAIDAFILARDSEEYFLDFKASANHGQSTNLVSGDRDTYEKCISGFANSEGGVIVWGIDCRRSDFDGADVAQAKVPIEDPKRFQTNLTGLTSGRTIPPHPTVENHAIEELKGNKGFVITYIPKADFAPLQTIKSKDFYIRSGDSFEKAPYGVIAGLFGKRPEPQPILMFTVYTDSVVWENGVLKFSMGLVLGNSGATILKRSYMSIMCVNLLGPNCSIQVNFRRDPDWEFRSFNLIHNAICKENAVIAPHCPVEPIWLDFIIQEPISSDLKLEIRYGCEGSPVNYCIFKNSADIAKQIFDDRIREKLDSGCIKSEVWEDINEMMAVPKSFNSYSSYKEFESQQRRL